MFIDPLADQLRERVLQFLTNEMAGAEHGQPTFGQTLSQKLGVGQRTTRSRNPTTTMTGFSISPSRWASASSSG
ncbi:MAG: hypothetical protein ACLP8S_21180 [Solirubrobacteraceae bacterium]